VRSCCSHPFRLGSKIEAVQSLERRPPDAVALVVVLAAERHRVFVDPARSLGLVMGVRWLSAADETLRLAAALRLLAERCGLTLRAALLIHRAQSLLAADRCLHVEIVGAPERSASEQRHASAFGVMGLR
jgi:hypothetical protein